MTELVENDARASLFDLALALDKIRMTLENSLVNMTKTKNGHLNLFDIMRVVRDLNMVHTLQWKVEQDSKGR